MKAIIFAGGVGTRLWPLSRKASPKQFARIIGDKSTLELAVERLYPDIAPTDIFISTGAAYVERTVQMLPDIPPENIIGEPVKKDNGAAVGMMAAYMAKRFPNEPIVILWSDHLVKHEDTFRHIISSAGEYLNNDPEKMIFIGQKPRFASDNLGWIETGRVKEVIDGVGFRTFSSFRYRPDEDEARRFFSKSHYCWNLGYFVTTAGFLHSLFHLHAPEIASVTTAIAEHESNTAFTNALMQRYDELPEINFDKAVLERLEPEYARVVIDDIGWSDIGAWEALKEALAHRREDNITKGSVQLRECKDNLVYNFDSSKLVVGVDISDLVVIETEDVTLVANKSSIGKVKEYVESLEGTEYEELT